MSYLNRVLQPGERVVYTTRLHWLVYLNSIVLLGLAILVLIASILVTQEKLALAVEIFGVILAVLGIASGLRAFVRRATTELAITDHRVIYKAGLISRHTLEMNRGKVESVDVDQTVLGRVFGYGTVVVRGTGGSLEPIRNITDPIAFRTHITVGQP